MKYILFILSHLIGFVYASNVITQTTKYRPDFILDFNKTLDYKALPKDSIFNDQTNELTIKTFNHFTAKRCKFYNNPISTFLDIERSLNSNEIYIELFPTKTIDNRIEYIAFSIKKGYTTPTIINLFDEQDLINEIARGSIAYCDTIISHLFLSPLINEVKNINTIYFIPCGELHTFGIEYSKLSSNMMLAEKYRLYRLTSSAILTQRKEDIKYKTYALFGGIDYDYINPNFEEIYINNALNFEFGYLRDSYIAAKFIDNILKENGLTGVFYHHKNATETNFKSISNKDIDLLLIETHGTNDIIGISNPYNLLFAGANYIFDGGILPTGFDDGILSSNEISNLNLKNINLAVISACKSGVGNIEWCGINGLIRSFKYAGCKSLVITIDNVIDFISSELWKYLFLNLVNGYNKYDSFIKAIKKLKTLDGWQDPEYWAAFILLDALD